MKASANSGYEILNKPHGISAGIVPTMQYKFNKSWATNFTIAPNFVFLNLQKSFTDWQNKWFQVKIMKILKG